MMVASDLSKAISTFGARLFLRLNAGAALVAVNEGMVAGNPECQCSRERGRIGFAI